MTDLQPASAAGRVLDGRYRLERLIGAGGMGTVYLSTQLAIDRQVAVKLMRGDQRGDVEATARFEREARTVSRLKSPHTVVLHDYGSLADGERYMVMEYLEGRSLAARLEEGRPSLAEVLAIVTAIVESLVEAHALGVVHRDLKPANVMLCRTGDGEHVKVLDFGIAALVSPGAHDGARGGTPGYVAPEALAGHADARADVYAVGAILYELLAGAPAFAGADPQSILRAQQQADPPPLADLRPDAPLALRRLCRRCLARDPRLRPRDAAELRAELEAIAEAPVTATTLPALDEGDLGSGAHAWSGWRGVLAVALGCSLAVAGWFAHRLPLDAPPPASPSASALPSGPLSEADIAELLPIAKKFLGRLERHEYQALDEDLDQATTLGWPVDQRGRVWEGLQTSLGAYQRLLGERSLRLEGLRVIFLELGFASATADLKLVFNDQRHIVGVWFTNMLPLPTPSASQVAHP